jgi:predicted acylesterase/phospholipase RssA
MPPESSENKRTYWGTIRAWYWLHFMKGVCFHLPLVMLLVVLGLLPFNVVGEGVGVAQLVWHEGAWERFLIGAAFGVLIAQVLFVSYLLWDRARTEGRLSEAGQPIPAPLTFTAFAACTLGCLLATTAFFLAVRYGVSEWVTSGQKLSLEQVEHTTSWWALAYTDAATTPVGRVWRFLLLPFGTLSVAVLVFVLGTCDLGIRLARKNYMARAHNYLETKTHLQTDTKTQSAVPRETQTEAESQPITAAEWPVRRLLSVAALVMVWIVAGWASAQADAVVWLPSIAAVGGIGFLLTMFFVWRKYQFIDSWPAIVFWFNLYLVGVLIYLFTTYAFSRHGAISGLGSLVAGCGLLVLLAFSLPKHASHWLARRLKTHKEPLTSKEEKKADESWWQWAVKKLYATQPDVPDPYQLWPFVLLAGLGFFLLANLSMWASPVPIVCFFLFGLVAAYGFATVVVRRAIPLALAMLLLLAIVAGVQPYKFRYDGYVSHDGTWSESLDYREPLDLQTQLETERKRQGDFDTQLRLLNDYRVEFATAERKYDENSEILKFAKQLPSVEQNLTFTAEQIQQAKEDEVAIREAYDAARKKYGNLRIELYNLWREMEQHNRVLAARQRRGDLDLAFLEQDSSFTHFLPDNPNKLLSVRHWHIDEVAKDQPLVIITVSGGGLRSAAWTFTVLRTLEEEFAAKGIDFPSHVRMITGASGGMLGSAYYVTTLPIHRPVNDEAYRKKRREELDQLYKNLTKDDLTPLVKQHVYEDLPNLFSPWPARNDRGKELERVWSDNLDRALDVTFADLRNDEREGRKPSLVFTPMMVEDGRRLIISNLDMRHAISNDGNILREGDDVDPLGSECHSCEALELFRLFPGSSQKFRLSTAVRMSASFPFFSPAVSLPTKPRRRIVDAGYYDNYGVSLASAWLISANNRNWILQNTSKILLIQIRDGVDQPQRELNRIDPETSSGITRSTEEMSSPFEGLYNARVSSSSFRNDGQLELLSQFWSYGWGGAGKTAVRKPHQDRVFQVVNFEFPSHAALSWYLSTRERDRLKSAMTQNVPNQPNYLLRVEKIHKWWKSPYKFEPE